MADFKYKNYTSKYSSLIDSLYSKRNKLSDSYDPYGDSAFVAAANDLERRQKYATESARARMNAAVGGTGSGTATATAMAQVNNDYIARINDLIPVYKQRTLDDIDKRIKSYIDAEDDNYSRYKDGRDFAFKSYISGRDFNYKKDQDKKAAAYQKKKDSSELNYKKKRDANELKYKKQKDARDYALRLKSLSRSGMTKSAAANSAAAKQQKKTLKSAMSYARLLWSNSDMNSIHHTLNYIVSLALPKKDTLAMITSLKKRNGKTALGWYTQIGYDRKNK